MFSCAWVCLFRIYINMTTLFSVVPIKSIVRLIHLMLCESKIVVTGYDVNLVSIVACSLPKLISPLSWECVHIPLKPFSLTASDLIDCPTPFIVGVVKAPPSPLVNHYSFSRLLGGSSGGGGKSAVSCMVGELNDIPDDVSVLDLDQQHQGGGGEVEECFNMLTEAKDFHDTLKLSSSSMLSIQLCNDILQALKSNTNCWSESDHDEEVGGGGGDENDDDDDDDDDEDFMEDFCHNKEFKQHQCNEMNEICMRCFGPLVAREEFKPFLSSSSTSSSSVTTSNPTNFQRFALASEIARVYAYGLSSDEIEKISDVRDILNKFINSLCEDVGPNYSSYGEVHPQQGNCQLPFLSFISHSLNQSYVHISTKA
jgi:hypothetical protein